MSGYLWRLRAAVQNRNRQQNTENNDAAVEMAQECCFVAMLDDGFR